MSQHRVQARPRRSHRPSQMFADQVQSMERLRQLLVLTVADIRAVGPEDLERLEGAAAARPLQPHRGVSLRRPHLRGPRARDRQGAGRAQAPSSPIGRRRTSRRTWSAGIRATGCRSRWPILERHARLVRDAEIEGRALSVDFRVDAWEAMTEVTIYVPDRVGLVSQLAGACALGGASIVEARIFTLKNGKALDVFAIQDSEGGPFDQPTRLARLTRHHRAGAGRAGSDPGGAEDPAAARQPEDQRVPGGAARADRQQGERRLHR